MSSHLPSRSFVVGPRRAGLVAPEHRGGLEDRLRVVRRDVVRGARLDDRRMLNFESRDPAVREQGVA